MDEDTRQALTNGATWIRGATMLLFFLLLVVTTPLLIIVSLFGWFGLLIKGRVPEAVGDFGHSLAGWYEQTARYLTGNASRRPFPFEDLDCPSDEPDARPAPASRSSSPAMQSSDGTTAGSQSVGRNKATRKKAGSKKAGKKKSGGKKSASKKASGKKASNKKSGKKKASGKSATRKAAGKTSSSTAASPEGGDGNRDE